MGKNVSLHMSKSIETYPKGCCNYIERQPRISRKPDLATMCFLPVRLRSGLRKWKKLNRISDWHRQSLIDKQKLPGCFWKASVVHMYVS
ncbi:hypothetical protein ILYODFUR_033421 [Ilyodon furcidens]|uniref:Uncharacterized protein n=1 Tax=Ilyodon furcidens TaxID=33524 RepID=A0ABV0TP00_9TELE